MWRSRKKDCFSFLFFTVISLDDIFLIISNSVIMNQSKHLKTGCVYKYTYLVEKPSHHYLSRPGNIWNKEANPDFGMSNHNADSYTKLLIFLCGRWFFRWRFNFKLNGI